MSCGLDLKTTTSLYELHSEISDPVPVNLKVASCDMHVEQDLRRKRKEECNHNVWDAWTVADHTKHVSHGLTSMSGMEQSDWAVWSAGH